MKIWSLESGEEIGTFRGHQDIVQSVCISPCCKFIASASHDSTIKIWDIGSGEEIKLFRGHVDSLRAVALSPDGSIVASGGADKQTLEEAKTAAQQYIRTLDRMVTKEDYESLIGDIQSVQKVNVLDVNDSTSLTYEYYPFRFAKIIPLEVTNQDTIWTIPQEEVSLSTTVRNSIIDLVDTKKVIGTKYEISDPSYVRIGLSFTLNYYNRFSYSTVENNVTQALLNWFRFDNSSRTFGEDMSYSTLLALLTAAEGVSSITNFVLSDVTNSTSGTDDISIKEEEYPVLYSLSITQGTGVSGG